MSRGALLQLIAKGEIDSYIIDDNIEKSIFNNVIKKVTNFSEVPFSFMSLNSATWGDTIRFNIKKVGDLLSNMYLVMELPRLSVSDIIGVGPTDNDERTSTLRVKWNDYIGNTIIENIILRIGGAKIDEMTGEYMQFYTDLYNGSWSKLCMIGHSSSLIYPKTFIEDQYVYIPIHFFFCNDFRKALPVIALEYHDIEIEVKLRTWEFTYLVLKQLINDDGITQEVSKLNFAHTDYKIKKKDFNNLRLDCNFIFLDGAERTNIVKKKHEILITQTQKLITPCNSGDSIYLNFTNPIKELIFVLQRYDYFNLGEIYNFSGKPAFIPLLNSGLPETIITDRLWNQIPDKHLLDNMSIEINGVERIPNRDYKYWHHVQNYEHYQSTLKHNLYMYNFGLTNKENTGSCNFSMLDSVKLNIKLGTSDTYSYNINDASKILTTGPSPNTSIKVYANNYNIFVIEGGMGGIMFNI